MGNWRLTVAIAVLGWACPLFAQGPPLAFPTGPMAQPMGPPFPPMPGFTGPSFAGPMPAPFLRHGEPTPVASSAANPNVEVPLLSQRQPPPKEEFSPFALSASGNAFDDDGYCDRCEGWYSCLGAQAMCRARLNSSLLAVRDPRGNPDAAFQPPAGLPATLDFKDIRIRENWGVRATIGHRWDCEALELTGYYMFQNNNAFLIVDPGRIDLPFAAFNPPIGFAGNNNLWLNADLVRQRLQTTLGNAEINYRTRAHYGAEYIIGARYFDYREIYGIFTTDDDITLGRRVPVTNADLQIDAHSHFVGLNLGFETEREVLPGVALGMQGKGAFGFNFVDVFTRLDRDDGFTLRRERSDIIFSYLFEGGLFVDLLPFERMRCRLGYNIMWLLNFPQAHRQLDFNIARSLTFTAVRRDEGDIFYHGPFVELQFQY